MTWVSDEYHLDIDERAETRESSSSEGGVEVQCWAVDGVLVEVGRVMDRLGLHFTEGLWELGSALRPGLKFLSTHVVAT